MTNRYILITHLDLDGIGCEIVFRSYFKDKDIIVSHASIEESNIRFSQIIKNENLNPKNYTIFFADMCPPEELQEAAIKRGFTCYVFDHHITASLVNGIAEGSVINYKGYHCGASLLKDFLAKEYDKFDLNPIRSKMFDEFVRCIASWDTWSWVKTDHQEAKYLNILFRLLGVQRFVKIYTNRFTGKDPDRFPLILPEHRLFIEADIDKQQEIIDRLTPDKVITKKVFGYNTAIVFTGTGLTFSEGSYQFLNKYKEYDIMININLGVRSISYRTIKNEIDLSQLVKDLGGGGHSKAAGSPIELELTSSIVDSLLKLL